MIKILLADDHVIFKEGLAELLKSDTAFDLVADANNGDDAWRLIQLHLPDIAILDISMPGLNGIAVASQLKKTGLRTRVVILTSHDDPTLALQAKEVGVMGYILKENSFDELCHAIRAVHGGGKWMSAQVAQKLEEFLHFNQRKTLSRRENEVLTQIAMGHTNKETALILKITPRTVDTHKTRLKEKLGLRTIGELAQFAVKTGLVK
ncbi:MAG: response regulator transcription factor [Magnetococcales bacterium]|nr:response regulator transcription factor [Magnetococcales bacterium]